MQTHTVRTIPVLWGTAAAEELLHDTNICSRCSIWQLCQFPFSGTFLTRHDVERLEQSPQPLNVNSQKGYCMCFHFCAFLRYISLLMSTFQM